MSSNVLWRNGKHKTSTSSRCDRWAAETKWSLFWKRPHIKLSSFVSDLLGSQCRRMLKALADGRNQTQRLWPLWRMGACAPRRNSCGDALGACADLNAVYPAAN